MHKNTLRAALRKLQFTENESAVYLALFHIGKTKIGPLLSETGLHRTLAYRALSALQNRGLIQKTTLRGVAYFEAGSLTPLIEEQEKQLVTAKQTVSALKRMKPKGHVDVRILSGIDGLHDLYGYVIKTAAPLHIIGANAEAPKRDPAAFQDFEKKRIQAKIRRFHLSLEQTRDAPFNTLPQTTVSYLPQSFTSPLVIWVFGPYVAQVLWEGVETIFLIQNKGLADEYRRYYRMLKRDLAVA